MQINLFPDKSLFAVLVIFVINYFVVRRFFIRPVNAVMEAREHETRSADALYEQAMNRFRDATAEMEAQLHGAKRTAAQVRERYRAEATAHRTAVVEKTSGEARGLVDEADAKLKEDVATARETIVRDSESLARVAAERILGRAV
jgi:F0F1-type ATP synthase membrane subunit b/b'